MIPETRSEQYLASIIGEEVELPVPQSRIEHYLNIIAQNGVAPSSAGLINYDPDASYPDGSIGKEVHELDGDVSELKSQIADLENRVVATWTKGLISAASGEIASSANGATSDIISTAKYVSLKSTCKAVVGFYTGTTYIGKLNSSGGIDKVGGTWGYITGNNDLTALMDSCNADGFTIGLVPTDGGTVTADTAQTYGDSHCKIVTEIYSMEIAKMKEDIERLENVTFNQSKGAFCIMQYNIGNWYNGTGYLVPVEKYDEFYDLQKSIIGRYQPDVLCMEEYRGMFTREAPASDLLNQYFTQVVSARDTTSYDGKGIASNRTILNAENVAFTDSETYDVTRNYEKCYIYLNGRKVLFVAAHLGSSSIVESNIDDLLSLVENEDYFVICGDMNINGDDALMAKFTSLGYKVANNGSITTYPSNPNYLSIDNIIVSANIEIKSVFADTQKENLEEGEDHYPLLAYLEIF